MTVEAAKEAPLQIIASDGDIILNVGLHQAQRMQVHSLMLMNASKVFSVMFSPQFKEGQDLIGCCGGPPEVQLPEDNPVAVSNICRILHGRNEASLFSLKSTEVLDISVTADKYDCILPLAFAIEAWLNPHRLEELKKPQDRWNLMMAAYWFKQDQAFSGLSKSLVMEYSGPYLDLGDNSHDTEMGLRFCLSLEERRTKMRMELVQILVSRLFSPVACTCKGKSKDGDAFGSVMRCLDFSVLSQDLGTKSVSDAIDSVIAIREPATNREPSKSAARNNPTFKGKLVQELKKFKTEQRGMSLLRYHPEYSSNRDRRKVIHDVDDDEFMRLGKLDIW